VPKPPDEELTELAAHVHAALSRIATLAATLEEEVDFGCGIRDTSHWLTINAGFDPSTSHEVVRVGTAMADLPLLSAAFGEGRLSFDKMRAVTRVATPADEDIWLELALEASGSQLQRVCDSYRRYVLATDEAESEGALATRGVWSHWRPNGMLRLIADLPAAEGAAILAALDARTRRLAPADIDLDPALDPWAAARADALVELCEDHLGASPNPAHRVVVHVDAAVLAGTDSQGICHVEDGPAISSELARRIGCDAELVTVTHRPGHPVDVGRATRVIGTRLRTALRSRDRGCRFPGCGVRSRRTHAHHLVHWAHGGPTDLDNLVSLCRFHHRRLHDGAYRIHRDDAGALTFETDDGRALSPPPLPGSPGRLRDHVSGRGLVVDAETPRAEAGGEDFDLEYAVSVIGDACNLANANI